MPGAFLSICRALLTPICYHIDMTDAIFLPLTRAWGGEGYDEAVGGGRVVTRAGRARINTRPIMQTYVGLEIIFFIWKRG